MANTAHRLNRLAPGFTATERAVLVLNAWKEGRPEGPELRRSVPEAQEYAFSRLLGLVRAVNGPLAWLAAIYEQKVTTHQMQLGWLQTMRAWGLTSSLLASDCLFFAPELLTVSEHVVRLAEARAETVTIEEAAVYLAERAEDEDESSSPAAADQEERIRQALAAGILAASGPDAEAVTMGALDDWLGETTVVVGESGQPVQVVSDEQADEVTVARARMERGRRVLRRAPVAFAEDRPLTPAASTVDQLAGDLFGSLAARLGSTVMEVRALERCLEDVAEEFAGEDALHPELRSGLSKIAADLEELVAAFGECFGELTIPEPSDAELEKLHQLLELAMQ